MKILQQAFLSVFQRIGEFRREGRWAFYRWLCRIADNRLRDALRAQQAAKRGGRREQVGGAAVGSESYEPLIEVLAGPSHTASRSVARHEALGAIQVGVACLKDNHRRAAELRYLRGLPVAEVAKMMGTTPHAVHSLCYRALQELHADAAQWSEAEVPCRRSLELHRQVHPAGHWRVARPMSLLGAILVGQGRYLEAEPLLREALEIRRIGRPPGHWETAKTKSLLGAALTGQGRFEEAESLLIESYPDIVADRGSDHRRTREAIARIIDLYEAWGRSESAAQWRQAR